ncbi:MAG: hypothetical protein JW395_3774 [Nitrospira sp.]|nr:hypothetical protein [Nitrospira sp.]
MSETIDFLCIGSRKTAGDPFPSQEVLACVALHVVGHCLVLSIDAQLLPASLLNQLFRIPETDREVLDQTDRVGPLPRVFSFFSTPLDESGPARQRRQLESQVVLPEFYGNSQGIETLQQRIFRVFGQLRYFPSAVCNPAGRPFMCRKRLPSSVQSFFPARHGPGRMTLVQKGLAPFDQFAVDLAHDRRAERLVAPVRKRDPATQRRLVPLCHGLYLLA